MGSIVHKCVRGVILLIACMSIASMYLFNINAGISFALGAAISLLPTLLFGRIFFKTTDASAARKVLNAFYIGEVIKILTTIVLFVVVFQWRGLAPLPLFLGFITAQLGYLLTLFTSVKT